jgi:hypothetical protein
MSANTYERNGFTVTIEYDQDCASPRDDESPSCKLVLAHRQYDLPNDASVNFGDFTGWAEVAQHLRDEHGALYLLAVYMIDHSGVALRVSGGGNPFWEDPGEWDSGQLGWAYITAETWRDCTGREIFWPASQADQQRARELITADVEQYGAYLNGECFGYRVTDQYSKELDSCWGIIGYEWAEQEANMSADQSA